MQSVDATKLQWWRNNNARDKLPTDASECQDLSMNCKNVVEKKNFNIVLGITKVF